jgi:hypothetical protein
MQIQNQTQQIAEEECLLPLSEGELESIAGGFIPDPPPPLPPNVHILSNKELDVIQRQAAAAASRPNPLDELEKYLQREDAHAKALSSRYGWGY